MEEAESYKSVKLLVTGSCFMQKEYNMVAVKFSETLKEAEILQIDRIQNPYYWNCYEL